jgi:hypothetical protein
MGAEVASEDVRAKVGSCRKAPRGEA